HTIAGLLDSRRSLTHPPCIFAPFNYDAAGGLTLRPFYRREIAGKRVLLADDVRNTGGTFARCAELVQQARGEVVATVEIYDRAGFDLGARHAHFPVPHVVPVALEVGVVRRQEMPRLADGVEEAAVVGGRQIDDLAVAGDVVLLVRVQRVHGADVHGAPVAAV